MANKSSSVVLMVLALVALWATSSKAQPPGVSINLAVVSGIVNCSLNSSTPAPPFPNATVELQCNGTTVAITVTDNLGRFSFRIAIPQLLRFIRDLIAGNCKVVVTTPLVACNATLPSTGTLVGPVVFFGIGNVSSILAYLFGIVELLFTP